MIAYKVYNYKYIHNNAPLQSIFLNQWNELSKATVFLMFDTLSRWIFLYEIKRKTHWAIWCLRGWNNGSPRNGKKYNSHFTNENSFRIFQESFTIHLSYRHFFCLLFEICYILHFKEIYSSELKTITFMTNWKLPGYIIHESDILWTKFKKLF